MAYASDSNLQWQTFVSSTIREDLADEITVMTPYDAPLQALLPVKDTSNTMYDWVVDELTRPTSSSTVAQGADATFPTPVARPRLVNYTNIVAKYFDVSGTQRAVNEAGVTDEYVYQAWKAIQEAIMQQEYQLLWGIASLGGVSSGGGGAAAAVTHGLASWVLDSGAARINSANFTIAGQTIDGGTPTVPGGYGSYIKDMDNAAVTRDNLMDVFENAHNLGMNVDGCMGIMSSKIKRRLSDKLNVFENSGEDAMMAMNERAVPAGGRAVTSTINWFEHDFGLVGLNINRYMNATTAHTIANPSTTPVTAIDATVPQNEIAIFFEPRMMKIRRLRGLAVEPLAKIGDSSKGMVVSEVGFQIDNPVAACAAFDYNVS